MSETPNFEAPIVDPSLTPEQDRRMEVLMNNTGFTGARAAGEVTVGGARQASVSSGPSNRRRPVRSLGQRQSLIADTPPQAHQAAMDRVSEGAPVDLTEEQRVFGAQQAQAFLKHLKNGSSKES